MSKKDVLFALFNEGKDLYSPEVKDIKLKSHTKATYYWQWKQGIEKPKGSSAVKPTSVKPSSPSGESIGGIDETRQIKKEATSPKKEAIASKSEETVEAEDEEVEDNEEANPEEGVEPEEPKKEESIGGVDESRGKGEKKDGQGQEKKGKYEITVADQGVRCVVFLSLQTLALYEIAAAKQAQLAKDGEGKLLLGDYLDSCSESFFKDRNLRLGLVELKGG